MLENRSFDHLLGFSGIQGKDPSGNPTKVDGLSGKENNLSPAGAPVSVSMPADFAMEYGPGHEFKDVQEQMCGKDGIFSSPSPPSGEIDPKINNAGYISNYARYNKENPESIMRCFSPDQVPVITTLAKEFVVCDRWFSSMPGPTWPNRFFVHTASSGGLDDSPNFSREVKSILYDGFKFENGTIYDKLDSKKLEWMIYCDDEFPQAISISGMRKRVHENFRPYKEFKQELANPAFSKSYVFIEPDYHAFTGKFRGGNSQHPMDDITQGERFLKDVYETIRNSPHWEKSLLIITYDEHGGFYDHVSPPATVHPGDSITDPSNNHNHFNFQQLGVRVPTIIVSPLISKGLIDHLVYDHTSVLATVEKLFQLGSLTKRDASANTLNHLFILDSPRTDAPTTLPDPPASGINFKDEEQKEKSGPMAALEGALSSIISGVKDEPIDPSLAGFHHVALLRDLDDKSDAEKESLSKSFLGRSKTDAVKYMHDVRQKISSTKKEV
jgi:phospholipase C